MTVPALRLQTLVDLPVRPAGDHVLYWMTANRRTSWNFALDRAIEHAAAVNKPLIVLEPLRVAHPWASDRFHAFVAQGMADNARAFATAGVAYHPYLEPEAGAGRGLLEALAKNAAVVVADDWPCFFLPHMLAAAAKKLTILGVRLEAVDSNGLLPIRAAGDQVFPTAYAFRRFLQKTLPAHLFHRPHAAPLVSTTVQALPRTTLPARVLDRWPAAADLSGSVASLQAFPIDHTVGPVDVVGGEVAARACLQDFVGRKLARFAEDRSPPDVDGQSGLSPWLHWGQLSAHEVADAVFRHEGFTPERLSNKPTGSREGWWGLSTSAESFLDQLVTWRELGFNFTSRRPDYDDFTSLPPWAQTSLLAHMSDERPHTYTLQELDDAATHDPLWNAAMKQLKQQGFIHNYLRMLWGKKVLEWSADPRVAYANLIELNNRYSVDGRDPNSTSGISWVFGRYDRPWGPTRPIYGVIRYMTSDNTMKKHACKQYLLRWNGSSAAPGKSSLRTTKPTMAQARLL
jgi:deoxyribodipyrimidine photo-lyase